MAIRKNILLDALPPRAPVTLIAFDRAFRRRMLIAICVSVVVNAIVFGTAGILGHQFLHSLQIIRERKEDVTIRRVFVRDLPGGGLKIVPEDGRPLGSPSH